MQAGRSFAVAALNGYRGFTARSRRSGLYSDMHRSTAPLPVLHRLAFMGLGVVLALVGGSLLP